MLHCDEFVSYQLNQKVTINFKALLIPCLHRHHKSRADDIVEYKIAHSQSIILRLLRRDFVIVIILHHHVCCCGVRGRNLQGWCCFCSCEWFKLLMLPNHKKLRKDLLCCELRAICDWITKRKKKGRKNGNWIKDYKKDLLILLLLVCIQFN